MKNPDIFDFQLEFTFSGDRLADLDRQISLLLTTPEGSMPLDREFGINTDWLDRPTEVAKILYTTEVIKKIPKFIPSVRVKEVKWSGTSNGKLIPKVVISDD